MPGRLWAQGYEAGRSTASAATRALRALQPAQIPGFAGKALRGHWQVTQGWEAKQIDYRVGFWDGFLDRAEELRRLPGTPRI